MKAPIIFGGTAGLSVGPFHWLSRTAIAAASCPARRDPGSITGAVLPDRAGLRRRPLGRLILAQPQQKQRDPGFAPPAGAAQ
jgi:hypothetical protein